MNEEHMMCSNVGRRKEIASWMKSIWYVHNTICIMRMRYVLTCKTHRLCYESIVSDLHEATEMRLSHRIQYCHSISVWTPNECIEVLYSGTWVPSSRAVRNMTCIIFHAPNEMQTNMVRYTIHAIRSMIHIIFHAHWIWVWKIRRAQVHITLWPCNVMLLNDGTIQTLWCWIYGANWNEWEKNEYKLKCIGHMTWCRTTRIFS